MTCISFLLKIFQVPMNIKIISLISIDFVFGYKQSFVENMAKI